MRVEAVKRHRTNLKLRGEIIFYEPEFYRALRILQDTQDHDFQETFVPATRCNENVKAGTKKQNY